MTRDNEHTQAPETIFDAFARIYKRDWNDPDATDLRDQFERGWNAGQDALLAEHDPQAWAVYMPSEEAQRVYSSQDDVGYVDDLTNNPDAEVTPLYAAPVAAQPQPSGNAGELPADVAAALARMDALLDPASGLLTVSDGSATVAASRADLATIRAALAAQASGQDIDAAAEQYHKMSCFIDHATGGRLSKPEQPLEALRAACDEHLDALVAERLQEEQEDANSGQDREDAQLTNNELQQFLDTCDQFENCGETSTDEALLMRWARMGLLDCTLYEVAPKGNALLDAARPAAKEGA